MTLIKTVKTVAGPCVTFISVVAERSCLVSAEFQASGMK